MTIFQPRAVVLAVLAALALGFSSTSAMAESLIEEITVTAQKREQDAQDVGISVSAFSGDQLNALGVADAADLADMTSGVSINMEYGTARAEIFFLCNRDCSVRSGARDRVTVIGSAQPARSWRVRDCRFADDAGYRKAAGNGFGHCDNVGLNAAVLNGKHLAGETGSHRRSGQCPARRTVCGARVETRAVPGGNRPHPAPAR